MEKSKAEDATMVLSASQIKTSNICTRKWYGQKVLGLPALSADHFTFGHVLHAVAERYLSATIKGEVPLPHTDWEYGKDRTYTSGPFEGQTIGDPVDILPKGWDKDISVMDSSLIAALIQKAIEEGVLRRESASVSEKEFWVWVTEDIWLMGFIDYFFKWEVQDHKTTKSFRYAKNPEELSKDEQLLIYAYAMLMEMGEPWPESVVVRHNYFLKDADNPKIRKVEAIVPVKKVLDFWEGIKTRAKELKYWAEADTTWEEVPGPEPGSGACQMYGGCAYQDICGGMITVEEYTETINKIKEQQKDNKPFRGFNFSALPKEKKMGLLEDRLNLNKSKTETKKEIPKGFTTPPWAFESCTACNGLGWNKKGNPCGICDQMITKKGMPNSEQIEWAISEGIVNYSLPDGTEGICSAPEVAQIKEVQIQEKTGFSPPAHKEESQSLVDSVPLDAPVESQTQGVESPHFSPDAPKKTKGRKKKSFTLAINCSPSKSVGTVKDLDQVFSDVCNQLAKDKGVDSYYLLPAFDRRDLICSAAETVAENLGVDTYLARPDTPDMRSFIAALRPFAYIVWEPIAGTVTTIQ